MNALFLGGHPALDFLNSVYAPHDTPIETIADGAALVRWLVDAGLLEAADAGQLTARLESSELDRTAATARELRDQARTWVDQWRQGSPPAVAAPLNKLCANGPFVWRIGAQGAVTPQPDLERPQSLLALIARQIALLFADEAPELTRPCAGSGCTLFFVDRSKAHRRRFCSAAVCGNRAKAAAFRERQQGQATGDPR